VVPPVVTSGRPGQKYSLVELLESKELHEFGQTLTRAYLFSGEAPSLTALEWADRNVALPDETTGDVAKFHEGVRQRIERQLREQTGAPHIGEWIKHARRAASLSEVQAAQDAELPVPAYQALERGRTPVWRTPAQPFARLCRRLAIDGQLLVRWMSLTLQEQRGAVFGRMDLEGEAQSEALDRLASEADQQSEKDVEDWRREFIAAYESSLGGDAPSGQRPTSRD
jgi:transcriptional regulator with XRE-family HTH domain